jgi:hypothetical protein
VINWALGEPATLHLQTPLSLNLTGGLRNSSSGMDFNFAVVILTPLKAFFLLCILDMQ